MPGLPQFRPVFLPQPAQRPPPRPPDLRTNSAAPLSGLTQGALQGLQLIRQSEGDQRASEQQKIQEEIQRKQLALQEKAQANQQRLQTVKFWGAMSNVLKMPPDARNVILPKLFESQGVSATNPDIKRLLAAASKKDSEVGAFIQSAAPQLAKAGVPLRPLIDLFNSDPAKFASVLTAFGKAQGKADLSKIMEQLSSEGTPTGAPSGAVDPERERQRKVGVGLIAAGESSAANALARTFRNSPAEIREREGAKKKFENDQPVPAAVSRLLGVSGLTVGQAKQFNISIPKEQGLRELTASEGFTKTTVKNTNNLIKMVQSNPESIGASGAFGAAANAIRAQAENFARVSGFAVEASRNFRDYEESFASIGITKNVIKSRVFDLAFSAAAANGQTGRAISDMDVKRFINIIGADTQDPESFVAVLQDFKGRIQQQFRDKIDSQLGTLQTATNPKTGKRVVFDPGAGKWIPFNGP